MKLPEQPFDPVLSDFFVAQCIKAPRDHEVMKRTSLFYWLNQPGHDPAMIASAWRFIKHSLEQIKQQKRFNPDFGSDPARWPTAVISPLPEVLLTPANLQWCLKQSAVILLTQPAWLPPFFMTAGNQTQTAIRMMHFFRQLCGAEPGEIDLQTSCQSLLLAQGITIPNFYSEAASKSLTMMPAAVDLATLQLALSHFPRIFLAEILGFTLAYCRLPTVIEMCFPHHSLPKYFFELRHDRTQSQCSTLLRVIREYLDGFSSQKNTLHQRIANGFSLYQWQMQCCREQINDKLQQPVSLASRVAEIIQHKASAAIGHHQKIQLQGKPLDEWFIGMADDQQQFLTALINSPYIDRQNPLNSRLLKLFEFNGPMQGVLNQSERQVFHDWLVNGLEMGQQPTIRPSKIKSPERLPSLVSIYSDYRYNRLKNRELYHYLVNADLYVDVLPIARQKVRKWLKLCALFNRPPFKQYSHTQFETYIGNRYQLEVNAYQPLQGKPKISREAYIWGLEQMAPMILIDGCWLQHSLTLEKVNTEISKILFSIYADELGNGRLEQNHPYIFQQLLRSLSIQLPPVHTEAFVQHPGFLDSAFDLPVFMMSLSAFSVEFLPELLGLNMAIELSGLGKGYCRLVDEWKFWGIDHTIASIHISIDNAASGHTFLAKQAIRIYLEDILQCTGQHDIMNRQWQRIYNGYASLRFVGKRLRFSLPAAYLIHKYQTT